VVAQTYCHRYNRRGGNWPSNGFVRYENSDVILTKTDVTAVVLSADEPTTQDAIDSVNRQSLPVHELIIVRGVTPFHKALNAGAEQVRTPFFVQVDADMVLDPHCVRALRKSVRPRVGIVIGHLRDALMGQVVGVKLFRTACFKSTSFFPDTISPDTDFVDDLDRAGWSTIYIGQESRRGLNAWTTLGEHRPQYSLSYTYQKYLLEGARYRYRQKPEGLRWHLGVLEVSQHPSALIAQIALARGIFLEESRDLLGAASHDQEFARIQNFLFSNGYGGAQEEFTLLPNKPLNKPLRELYGAYCRLGHTLMVAGASPMFEKYMRALKSVANDEGALVAKIGLCQGLTERNGDALQATRELEYRVLHNFIFKNGLRPFAYVQEDSSDSENGLPYGEAIARYVTSSKVKRFVIDGSRAGEYQIDYSVEPPVWRSTGGSVTSFIDAEGRPRIKLPFKLLGQIVCTQPERAAGLFWCLDLLRAGYAFVHLPASAGPRKVLVAGALAKNCLLRVSWLQVLLSRFGRTSLRSGLQRLARRRNPDYRPIPRRILMITSTFACGGSERRMLSTSAALVERNYDVSIMALWPLPSGEPNIEQEVLRLGIQPRLWSDFTRSETRSWCKHPDSLAPESSGLPRWFAEKSQSIEAAIRELRPSIVHAWLDLPGVVAALTSCSLGAPKVVVSQCSTHQHVRTFGTEAADLTWKAYRAIIQNPAVTILNNSVAAAKGYEQWLRLRPGTIRVLPNCFRPETVRSPMQDETAQFRAKFGIPPGAPVVGTMMRFVPDKDPKLWVDTAAQVACARPEVRFVLAGSGNLQPLITSEIKRLGIADRFVLLGTVADVGLVYSSLDVVLLTSIVEGLPNVLIEAQAAGRPVVTTDVGGTKEAVLDGRTGILVTERSATQLAQAVLAILDDPAWRDRVRVAGPEFVGERFGGDRMIGHLLEIYGEAPHAAEAEIWR
jgi:glycosyltransferase involved in cell wall biosynthesis